jgi:hypothetical protein
MWVFRRTDTVQCGTVSRPCGAYIGHAFVQHLHNTSHNSSTQFATLQRNTLYNYAANSSLSSQETPLILWNQTVRYSSSQQYYSTPRTNVTDLPPQSSPIIKIYCKTVRNPETKATGTCRSSSNKLGNAGNNSALCLPRCNDLAKR